MPRTPKTIYFRFGRRIICATGAQADSEHPNVLLLSVHDSVFSRLVQTLIRIFPAALGSYLRSAFPEWALPTQIVLKQRKECWDEEFATEARTYDKLRCLQGHVIPIKYGVTEYDGITALILSNIGGACVAAPEGAVLDPEAFGHLLDQALRALANFGISHDDLKLDNFHLVGKRHNRAIMVVDLERVDEVTQEQMDLLLPSAVEHLIRYYKIHLECLEHDGLLLPTESH